MAFQQMTPQVQNRPSLVQPPGGQANGGVTHKEQMVQLIAKIPLDQLIKLIQGTSPEELAQKIQQLCIQQGMDRETAVSFAITLMKVIYERIQNETGKPITDFMKQGMPENMPPQRSLVQAPPGGQNANPA